MGLRYIIASLAIYDEYSNDVLDMHDGTWFPQYSLTSLCTKFFLVHNFLELYFCLTRLVIHQQAFIPQESVIINIPIFTEARIFQKSGEPFNITFKSDC